MIRPVFPRIFLQIEISKMMRPDWSSTSTSNRIALPLVQKVAVPEAAEGQSFIGHCLHYWIIAGPADGGETVFSLFQHPDFFGP